MPVPLTCLIESSLLFDRGRKRFVSEGDDTSIYTSLNQFVESDIGKWSVKNKLGHHSEHTNKALEGEALQQLHKHLYNNYKPHVMHMLLCDYGCLG